MRRYGVLALALFAAAAAGGQEVPARPEALSFPPLVFTTPAAEPHRHALAAGNTVYVVEDPALPLFELVLSLPVGGFLDPPGRPGVAELTARLLERGPAAGRSSREIEQSFGRMAGRWSVATGLTRSVVTLDGLSSELEPSVALLFDLLAEPAFDPERIEQEKRRWIAERAQSDAEPAGRLDRWWSLLLYGPDHVATRRPTDEQILAITRDDLAAFHRRFWSPRHAGLAVSGDVPAAAAVDLLERQVRRWADSAGAASTPLPPPPGDAGTPRPGLFLAEADAPRVWIAVGHPGPRRDGRWTDRGLDAWLAGQEILAGGGFTSRLVRRLRGERGLVYWIEADPGVGEFWPGSFQIRFETSPEHAAAALETVLEELRGLGERPVTDEELRLALTAVAAAPVAAFRSSRETARTWLLDDFVGRPHSLWSGLRRRVAQVTGDDVRAAARRHLRMDRLTVLLVGPARALDTGALERVAGRPLERLPEAGAP